MKRKAVGDNGDQRPVESTAADVTTDSTHGSTIFVSNLPYTTTNTSLETAFSDLAPVKSAFVVFHKSANAEGPSMSKGVGYISFALKEDAESTMDLYGEGSEQFIVDGRKVRLQWANRKPPHAEKDSLEKPSEPISVTPRTIRPRTGHQYDANAIRTIILSNVPQDITASTLWKKVRKQDGAESVEWPAKDATSGNVIPGVAHALFENATKAQAALTKLHGHVYKGSVISAVLKKRADALQKGSTTAGSVVNKAGRLIVRNLPHNISENDLHTLFSPYGPIHSVHIPKVASTSSKRPMFAFVWMLSKADAENAINRLNGTKVAAGLAVKAAEKAAHKKAKRKRKDQKSVQVEGESQQNVPPDPTGDVVEEIVEAVSNATGQKGSSQPNAKAESSDEAKVIAVDWALSKSKWEEMKRHETEGVDNDHSESEEADENLGVHDDDAESNADSESAHSSQSKTDGTDVDSEDDEQVHNPPPPDEGTTLFVRNVPFEATDDDLRLVFRTFGPLRYARVTKDPDTGRSRGTGFACFWKLGDADAALAEAKRVKAESGLEGNARQSKKPNPFSLLTPDPSSSLAARLVLMGRTLDVIRAVNREEAGRLREQGEKLREKKDARNLYLMREGVIFESAPAAQTLSQAELERRTASFNARKQLLKSNPSLYISRTRLSIRQLPTFVTERVLKRLGLHAVKAFEAEVHSGSRDGLTADEVAVDKTMMQEAKVAELAGSQTSVIPPGKRYARLRGVKQAKIARQAERVDPLIGKGKSRGYGFLEMHRHSDSLKVLRWVNNREGVSDLMWTWWKEELEDTVKRAGKGSGSKEGTTEAIDAKAEAARLELVRKKLKDMSHDNASKGKALLVEFSIENVVVTKRRAGRERSMHEQKPEVKGRDVLGAKRRRKDEDDGEPSPSVLKPPPSSDKHLSKKPKLGTEPNADTKKAGRSIGGVIGKKRKERSAKRQSSAK